MKSVIQSKSGKELELAIFQGEKFQKNENNNNNKVKTRQKNIEIFYKEARRLTSDPQHLISINLKMVKVDEQLSRQVSPTSVLLC